jgi:hypothetical protein
MPLTKPQRISVSLRRLYGELQDLPQVPKVLSVWTTCSNSLFHRAFPCRVVGEHGTPSLRRRIDVELSRSLSPWEEKAARMFSFRRPLVDPWGSREDSLSLRISLDVPRVLSLFLLVSGLSAQVEEYQARFGVPQDWSHRHIVFNRQIVLAHPELANIEPRALRQFLRQMRSSSLEQDASAVSTAPSTGMKRDWSVNGIGANMPFGMSPAKFGFDDTTASCASDYVLFGLNAVGATGGQGNLVAYNKLYTGTGGLCGGAGPSLLFSYNITTAAGGKIRTATVLSLDGKNIAFVESGTSSSVFHVLTWATGAGNGTSATVSAAPGNGNTASMTSLTFDATATDSLSSPWIDYGHDVAYVGADDGLLYKITGVFNGTPTLAGAPWPITVGAGGPGKNLRLTAPVLDQITNNIFVGDGRGILWSINSNTPTTVNSLVVGQFGKLNPSILDAPIVDVANGTVFAVSSNAGTSAVLVQADTTTLAQLARANLGAGSTGGTGHQHLRRNLQQQLLH